MINWGTNGGYILRQPQHASPMHCNLDQHDCTPEQGAVDLEIYII